MSSGGRSGRGPRIPKRATGTFDRTPSSPSEARRFVREIAEQYGSQDLEQRADLLVSELVTNAVQHSSKRVAVGVDLDVHRLRVEVSDDGQDMPRVEHEGVWSEHGRGLRLVEAISDAWGVAPQRGGKRVWFELRPDRSVR